MKRVHWKEVGLFLGVTFGLTYLLDLLLWLKGGLASTSAVVALQAQMLLPAFSAILLGLFVFRNSPLYHRSFRERPRWFFFYFIIYTVIYLTLAGWLMLAPASPQALTVVSLITQAMTMLGLLLIIVLRVLSGREAFARAGLAGGKPRHWLLAFLGVTLFFGFQTALNYAFHLGQSVDIMHLLLTSTPASSDLMGQLSRFPAGVWLALIAFQSIVVGPFLGLLITFGEEYGWRGYLQSELVKWGNWQGVLLVGLIWGIWHVPVILMGHNYPGYPVAGVFLMIALCVGLAFVFGYAVLKSGSIWLAAFLHALTNQTASFFSVAVYMPRDPVFSFGVGLYGILTLAVLVIGLLWDPLWRREGA